MSFSRIGNKSNLIQESIVLILMIIFSVAIMYSNINFLYKIMISFFAFAMIFLAGLLNKAIEE